MSTSSFFHGRAGPGARRPYLTSNVQPTRAKAAGMGAAGAIATGILAGSVIGGLLAAGDGRSAWPVLIIGLFTGVLLITGVARQSHPGLSGRTFWPDRF